MSSERWEDALPRFFCTHRRLLYQRQLDDTKAFLRDFLGSGGFTGAQRRQLGDAVRDRALLDAFEDIVIPYVIYGVARDFKRLGPTSVLFSRNPDPRPAVDDFLPRDGSTPDPVAEEDLDRSIGERRRYRRYFDWFIFPRDVGGGRSGVTAFYERYPLLGHAIETVTANYQANIELACKRIARDWDDIRKAFFPGRTLERLIEIKTTGNDFHKGGKQVLILTFELDQDGPGRVVYKPSPVEIDCRIVGDSSVFARVQPKGERDTAGYTQTDSLTELMNRHRSIDPLPAGAQRDVLPVYGVLPYNRTSLPDAYGYIEFLTHLPEIDITASSVQFPELVIKAVTELGVGSRAVKESDWIAGSRLQAITFCHQLGAVTAMALGLSLCDLHLQNLIVHGRSPHLIDLEEAVKWPMRQVDDTYLVSGVGAVGRYYDPGSPVIGVKNDFTDRMEAERLKFATPAACALYVVEANGEVAPVRLLIDAASSAPGPADPTCQRAYLQGFAEGMETLATRANPAVIEWARGLDRTLARFVTVATEAYATDGRDLYGDYCDSAVPARDATGARRPGAGWYAGVQRRGPTGTLYGFGALVAARRTAWVERQKLLDAGQTTGSVARRGWNHPFFALEHPDHVWRDYFNCDVPSFYHFLGSTFLLNSKGDQVDVNVAIRDQAGTPPAQFVAKADGSYLPMTPIAMVVAELRQLADDWTDANKRRARLIEAFSNTGFAGPGKTVFDAIVPPSTQTVSSGATS